MKNECPESLAQRWDPRWDARPELLRLAGPAVDPDTIDKILDSMLLLVGGRPKTCFVGFGTWTRKPYRRKTPDGRTHSTMRICFNLADAAKKRLYGGRHMQKEERQK